MTPDSPVVFALVMGTFSALVWAVDRFIRWAVPP